MTAMPLPLPRFLSSVPASPRWLPRVVELALLLVLAVLIGRLVVGAFEPELPLLPVATADVGATAIPAIDLFYRRPGQASGGTGSVGGLVLHGIRGGANASAILAGEDGVQHAWAVGSEPARGVVLDRIGSDHVVLRRAGGTVRLDLAARATTAPRQAATTPSGPVRPEAMPSASTSASANAPAKNPSPAKAPAAATPSPAPAPAPAGHRLGTEAERLPLRLAGLRPGDEILSINGQAVGEDPASLRERLAGQTRFELRYRRDGELRTATVGLP